MGKSPKYVSAAYLSERTSLTARWFTGQACEGKIPGAVQPAGPGGASRRPSPIAVGVAVQAGGGAPEDARRYQVANPEAPERPDVGFPIHRFASGFFQDLVHDFVGILIGHHFFPPIHWVIEMTIGLNPSLE